MARIKRAARMDGSVPRRLSEEDEGKTGQNTLQTLDRGLRTLTLVAERPAGVSIAELAEQFGVHRAIVYRLVTTLEAHGLIARSAKGTVHLGAGLVALASRFEPQFRAVAQPVLRTLANETRAAAFISVPQGYECVAIMVAEPEGSVLRVTYRLGSRHPLTLGAAGIAILAGRTARSDDLDPVRQARTDGFSVTHGQLQRGAVGVASPLHDPTRSPLGFEASVGVVTIGEADIPRLAVAVMTHAQRLRALLSNGGMNEAGEYGDPARAGADGE